MPVPADAPDGNPFYTLEKQRSDQHGDRVAVPVVMPVDPPDYCSGRPERRSFELGTTLTECQGDWYYRSTIVLLSTIPRLTLRLYSFLLRQLLPYRRHPAQFVRIQRTALRF